MACSVPSTRASPTPFTRRISLITRRLRKSPRLTESIWPSVDWRETNSKKELEVRWICTPCCCTELGRRASTRFTRFCTSTMASWGSDSGVKDTVICARPARLSDSM